jgi:hypothetical protein
MVTNEMTVADILIYSEISTVLAVLDKHHTEEIEHKFTHLSNWHTTMSQQPHIKECDEHLRDLVERYNLQERH